MSEHLEEATTGHIQVPANLISEQALDGLISEFVLREGTDYGHSEPTLDEKTDRVRKQLQSGRIIIAFSLEEETCTLLTKEDFRRLEKAEATSKVERD